MREARVHGCIGEAHAVPEQSGSTLDAHTPQILAGRQTETPAELTYGMRRMYAEPARDITDAQRFSGALMESASHVVKPPGDRSLARRLYANGVRHDLQHDAFENERRSDVVGIHLIPEHGGEMHHADILENIRLPEVHIRV